MRMLVVGGVVVGENVCSKSKNIVLVLKEGLEAYRH